MPVLYVSHDEDGEWQFLCGGDHPDDGADTPVVVCLKHLTERDETLHELAGLCRLSEAQRDRIGADWKIHDHMEDIVRDNVRDHACHVMKIDADDVGPGFVYSIGLTKTYGGPELICFGLDSALMHWMINQLRDRMASGGELSDGTRISDLIKGYDCVLREMQKRWYRDYFGYALWFYGGGEFDVLQIVWPDKQHHFPWDPEYSLPAHIQPTTWAG